MRGLSDQFKDTVAHLMAIPARSICMGFAISLLALCAWSAQATGTIITVSRTSDFKFANLGANGTFKLWAYSMQLPAIGPNATNSITTLLGGTAGTLTPNTKGSSITVLTGVVGQNQAQMLYGDKTKSSPRSVAYGPTVTTMASLQNKSGSLQKSSLSRNGDNVTVTSTSGSYNGQAKGAISAAGMREISVRTSISGTPTAMGSTAAEAVDPFQVPSGSAYGYDPTVDASVELDSPNVAGGFGAFAVDSSTFTSDSLDNFVDDGSPLDQTLWYLSVGGDTPTTSTNALLVNFQFNPLALNEIQFSSSFLASLGTYTDANSESLLIDQAIDKFITSQLVPNGNEVDLNSVHLFPTNTMFQPIDGGVEYANGVAAVVSPAPEPASLAILAVGLLSLAAFRRSPAKPSAASTSTPFR